MRFALFSSVFKTFKSISFNLKVISMINDIKESLIKLVDETEWLSDSVKTEINKKLLFMDLKIGFPKELLNEELLDIWVNQVKYSPIETTIY